MGFYLTTVVAMPVVWCETCAAILQPTGERPSAPDFLVRVTCPSCRKQYQYAAQRIPATIVDGDGAPRELLDIADGEGVASADATR